MKTSRAREGGREIKLITEPVKYILQVAFSPNHYKIDVKKSDSWVVQGRYQF